MTCFAFMEMLKRRSVRVSAAAGVLKVTVKLDGVTVTVYPSALLMVGLTEKSSLS